MTSRRSTPVVAAMATLVAPVTAFAQGLNGTVTTGPAQHAPTLTLPLIALLAIALGVVALRRLRVRGPIVGLILVAALLGVGSAFVSTTITITGAQCTMQTTNMFDSSVPTTLMSKCADGIHIISIEVPCSGGPVAGPPCTVGETLADGQSCTLPLCCPTGMSDCSGGCVDTTSDSSNCGSCGTVCPDGGCSGGLCTPSCLACSGHA